MLLYHTPSQVLEDQKFLQSEHESRALEKKRVSREKSEPKENEQERVSETHSEGKQERKDKHTIKGAGGKESQKKSLLLRKSESFPITMFSLLQEAEKKLVNAKPPELPLF